MTSVNQPNRKSSFPGISLSAVHLLINLKVILHYPFCPASQISPLLSISAFLSIIVHSLPVKNLIYLLAASSLRQTGL